MNVSLIVHFCTIKVHLQFRSFFNTLRILKKINVLFVVHFCTGKYSFSLCTLLDTLYLLKKINAVCQCPQTSSTQVLFVVGIKLGEEDMPEARVIRSLSSKVRFNVNQCPQNNQLNNFSSFSLKKITASSIVYFYLAKYSFVLDSFSTQPLFWGKWKFPLLFISLLENTTLVSVLFQQLQTRQSANLKSDNDLPCRRHKRACLCLGVRNLNAKEKN